MSFPSAAQRVRVIGNDDLFGFRLSGSTDARRLMAAAESTTGRRFRNLGPVLDWGCGCGRVARYLSAECPDFLGCDIDADNVLWCSNNLEGTYHKTALRPPLPFHDEQFGLVYGISVLTHLREPLQDQWLAELRRITRPGGLVCLTVHGQTALDYAGLKPVEYAAMKNAVAEKGIFISGRNDQLDGAVEESGEYLNVFHASDYIRSHWSRWFRIKAELRGYIYTHDLVILERLM
jgi:SAM-dependent methyltransferase